MKSVDWLIADLLAKALRALRAESSVRREWVQRG